MCVARLSRRWIVTPKSTVTENVSSGLGAYLNLSDFGAEQLIIVRGMKCGAHDAGDCSN